MPANKDAAASIGLPAAVRTHPGFEHHLDQVQPIRGADHHTVKRDAARGARKSRQRRVR